MDRAPGGLGHRATCADDADEAHDGDAGARTEHDDLSSASVTALTVPPLAPGDAAPCTTEAYRDAVALGIHGGHYPIADEWCDGR